MGSRTKFVVVIFLVMLIALNIVVYFDTPKSTCVMTFNFTLGFLFGCMFIFFEKACYVYHVDGKDADKSYDTLNEVVDAIVKECGSDKKIKVKKW